MKHKTNVGRHLADLLKTKDRLRSRRAASGSRTGSFSRPGHLIGPYPYTFSVTGMEQYNR